MLVIGLDGLSRTFAEDCWVEARTRRLASVFPTTTSAGWLSSLTGLGVDQHLVPGVVFADPGGTQELVNVFEYTGADLTPARETVFTDARRLGYRPLAVHGDMETYGGAWRDALLRGAEPVIGHRFYTLGGPYRERDPDLLVDLVRRALAGTLALPGPRPRLVWCYVELDVHVHRLGYDRHTARVLTGLEKVACELADGGAIVIAHADHGLVPTRPDPDLTRLLDDVTHTYGCRMGGAGRTRWLHLTAGTADAVAADLTARLPESVRLARAEELFAPAVRRRIGELVLIAEGDAFLVDAGVRYEHGSATAAEVNTPWAQWGA
ncbi:MAG: alkaline phosphatase family protein [Kineosporiaceae bacterium]